MDFNEIRLKIAGALVTESDRSISRRNLLFASGLGLLSALFSGCGGGNTSSPAQPGSGSSSSKNSRYTLMTNSLDPLLITASTLDGRTVEVYGTKDAKGVPLSVFQILVRAQNNSIIRYSLDDTGHVTKIISSAGTQFLLSWQSASVVAVTAISHDGKVQVNTTANLTQPGSRKVGHNVRLAARAGERNTKPRGGKSVSLTFRANVPASKTSGWKSRAEGNGTCVVQVYQCGALDKQDADAFVVATEPGPDGKFLGYFPALPTGQLGTYAASIPSTAAPVINPAEILKSIVEKLEYPCNVMEAVPNTPVLICSALGAAVSVITDGAAQSEAAEINGSCTEVFEGFEKWYCNVLGKSPVETDPSQSGSPTSLIDLITASKTLNREFVSPITLTPYVKALPQDALGLSETSPGNGPFPPLRVDLGGITEVKSFTLDPPDPVPMQGYVGTATLGCLEPNTSIKMSIIGTDGYSDSVSYSISSQQADGDFTLQVPGANDPGIQDTVTLTISLPDETEIVRTAFLVFI